LSLEGGTDRLSRNVLGNYHSTLRKIPKERRYYLKTGIQGFISASINYDYEIRCVDIQGGLYGRKNVVVIRHRFMKTGSVLINVKLRRVRVAFVAVERQ
jgi:hypothetical protein